MEGDSIMQETQKTETFKLILNLSIGKKTFFLPNFISATDAFAAAEWTEKLNAETVPFDLLKEATQFVVKVFGNRFTVEEFLDGIHAWFLTSIIYSICLAIVGRIAEAVAIINAIDSKTNSSKKETTKQKEPFKPTEMMLGIYSMLQDSGISQTDINQMDLVLFFKTMGYKHQQEDKNVVRTADQAPAWL